MGEREQIKVGNIYLYTHWEGYKLKNILKEALQKRWRWTDEEYLLRIIFEVMIQKEQGTETGYGISNIEHTDLNYPLLEIDVDNQIIKEESNKWTFEDFIKSNFKEDE